MLGDGDRRRKILDPVDRRTVELRQQRPDPRGKGVDEPPLGFREDRVERQARLSGSADARDRDDFSKGDLEVEIGEMMDADAEESDRRGAGPSERGRGVAGPAARHAYAPT